MSRRSGANAGFPAMRHYDLAAILSQLHHSQRFGETADSSNIRLHDIHLPAIHKVQEFIAGLQPFAGCNADVGGACCDAWNSMTFSSMKLHCPQMIGRVAEDVHRPPTSASQTAHHGSAGANT